MASRTDRAGLLMYAPQDEPALFFTGRGALFGIPMPIFVFVAAAPSRFLFCSRIVSLWLAHSRIPDGQISPISSSNCCSEPNILRPASP